MIKPEDLLRPTPAGLYCPRGDFYVDPVRPVPRAVVTHGHSDHARSGHGAVLATGLKKDALGGEVAIAPPSAIQDRWARRFADPVPAFASGWMLVKARARQRGVELPLVISDHADWPELTATFLELKPEEVWITHGREEGLLRWLDLNGMKGRALRLVGYDEEDDAEAEAA